MFEQFKIDDVVEQATKMAKDSVYFTVGLAAVTVQRAQEQFEELRRSIEGQRSAGRSQVSWFTDRVEPQLKALDERFAEMELKLDGLVEQLADRLPDAAKDAVLQVHDAAKSARAQVRELWLGEAKAA